MIWPEACLLHHYASLKFWLLLFLGLPPVPGLGFGPPICWADDSGGNVRSSGLPKPEPCTPPITVVLYWGRGVVMGGGKLSNGYIITAPEPGFSFVHHPAMQNFWLLFFKILFCWSRNSFLDPCAERISNGRGAAPEHRILGVQPNTDQPTHPIQTSFQKPIFWLCSIFIPILR